MALSDPPPAGGFDYDEMVGRNLGFVTQEEQDALREARVFVCGVGGMGGACLMSLVRAGVGKLVLCDLDEFELSNINRQLFASLETVGEPKVDATVRGLRTINPELEIETYGGEWVDYLDEILPGVSVVINGMDDFACGLHLYRRAAAHGATIIDAYASPLPSVTVVGPHDPRPEERLRFPTLGKAWNEISDEDRGECGLRESEYVLIHSSARNHIDLEVAAEMIAGLRNRPSLAPMVITTGNLMCFEALNVICGRPPSTDHRGYFFNPWTARVERPRGRLAAALWGFLVRRFLRKMLDGHKMLDGAGA